jgi:SM-20-related protein
MNIKIINEITDIEDLKQKFANNKKISIKNFLQYNFIESLLRYISMEKNWTLSTGIDNIKYEKSVTPQNDKINNLQIKNVNNSFSKDHFSYIFYRSMNAGLNGKKMSFFEFTMRQTLSSKEFIDKLNSITNLGLTKLTTFFLSKYKSGCFLSPHSDKGNGRLAFVLHLTKNWKPQYGGLLHFMNTDRTEVTETFVPIFNTFLIFEVPVDIGIPHYVSHVNPNITYNRYAITGWFD